MWKIKFFLIVETILGVLAVMTMLSNDLSRVIILSILFLLLIYYYRGNQRSDTLLLAVFFLFFFVTVLNPFVIAGILFAIFYGYFVLLPDWKRKKIEGFQYFQSKTIQKEKNPWWGDMEYFSQGDCQFDDLNLVRLSGRDIIHLDEVIVNHHDNIILLRKVFGDTKIIVPFDMAVSLQVTSLYGEVVFLDESVKFLRNDSLTFKTSDYERSNKSVKIIISALAGKLEVVRA